MGTTDGNEVGAFVGTGVGERAMYVGEEVGNLLGRKLKLLEGGKFTDGSLVGSGVRLPTVYVGKTVGDVDGATVGLCDGTGVGLPRIYVGDAVGDLLGATVEVLKGGGFTDGSLVGSGVGSPRT